MEKDLNKSHYKNIGILRHPSRYYRNAGIYEHSREIVQIHDLNVKYQKQTHKIKMDKRKENTCYHVFPAFIKLALTVYYFQKGILKCFHFTPL